MKVGTKPSNIPHTTNWTQSVCNSSCVKRKDAKDQSTTKNHIQYLYCTSMVQVDKVTI